MSRSTPDVVVVAGAAADIDLFGHGDLHVVDVAAVPERLEDRVGEPQHQHVLHGLFAEVVVDAIDLLFGKDLMRGLVQLLGRLQVGAKRLFDHDPPHAARFIGQAGRAEIGDGRWHRALGAVER